MKRNIRWGRILLGLLVVVVVLVALIFVPPLVNTFHKTLSSEITTKVSYSVAIEQNYINMLINDFFILFVAMLVILAVINLLFLLLEELVTGWYKGNVWRIILQIVLNLICFVVFACLVFFYLPTLAGKLNAAEAYGTMALYMLIAAFITLVVDLLLARPTNRDSIFFPRQSVGKEGVR